MVYEHAYRSKKANLQDEKYAANALETGWVWILQRRAGPRTNKGYQSKFTVMHIQSCLFEVVINILDQDRQCSPTHLSNSDSWSSEDMVGSDCHEWL